MGWWEYLEVFLVFMVYISTLFVLCEKLVIVDVDNLLG